MIPSSCHYWFVTTLNTRELINSSDSEAMIYVLLGSLGLTMSSFQSEFYSLTCSFSQLGSSISCNLPMQSSHASCQCFLKWLNGKVFQHMLKLQYKLATKHWHCNICKGVVALSIMITNLSISFSLLQLRKILL